MSPQPLKLLRLLKRGHVLALGLVCAVLVINLLIVDTMVQKQRTNGQVINVAGRQRILSQRLSKLAIYISLGHYNDTATISGFKRLPMLNSEWGTAQNALISGSKEMGLPQMPDDDSLKTLYAAITPHFLAMHKAFEDVGAYEGKPYLQNEVEPYISQIVEHERVFLALMGNIVDRLVFLQREKVTQMQWATWAMHLALVLLILLEVIFIFRPIQRFTARYIGLERNARHELEERLNELQAKNEELHQLELRLNSSLSELQRAHLELSKKENLLLEAQVMAGMGSYEYDIESRYTDWSTQIPKLFKMPENTRNEDVVLADFFTPEDGPRLVEEWRAAVLQGLPYSGEFNAIAADGSPMVVKFSSRPVVEPDGSIKKYFGILLDYTKIRNSMRQLEEARAKAEEAALAKTQFLSTMSHEIRTPMNAVIGFTQLLLMDKPRPDQVDGLTTLSHSAQHLLTLINDILDFNKIDSGHVEFEELEFDLDQLMNNIVGMFRLKAEEKNILLDYQRDASFNCYMLGDTTRLTQVFTNLLGNAIKFTSRGRITLSYTVAEETQERAWLRFSVKDTGIGIPEDKLQSVFESFTQAAASTTRLYGGTGLGLAICKRLVQLMGGALEVKSSVGIGSEFYFTLPLTKGNHRTPTVAPTLVETEEEANKYSIANKHILVVEDNPVNRKVASLFLRRWNVNAYFAENGQQAVDMTSHTDYDLILMDLQMPIMDGYKATLEIRQMPRYRKVPIVALTASASIQVKEEVLRYGMDDIITKPFQANDLLQIISRHIRKRPGAGVPLPEAPGTKSA